MIRESKIVRINNNTDCRRRVEYLHKAYNVLIDPEKEVKEKASQQKESARRIGDSVSCITQRLHPYVA